MKLKIVFFAYVVLSLGWTYLFYTKFQHYEEYTQNLLEELHHARGLHKKLTTDKSQLNNELNKKGVKIDKLERDVDNRDESIRNLQQQKVEQDSRIAQLNQDILDLEEKINDADSDVAAQYETLINQYKRDKLALEFQNGQIRDSLTMLGALNDTLTEQRFYFEQRAFDLAYLADSLRTENKTKDSLMIYQGVIKDIVENTTITIDEIKPSEEPNAKGIKKIKKDRHKEKWKYTNVKFSMDHPREDLLKGKKFAFRLQNLDEGLPVEFNENSASKSNLVRFTYLFNNEFEQYHYNHQKKDGENYEIQFVLINGEEEHLLYNGKFSVYHDGKWTQP